LSFVIVRGVAGGASRAAQVRHVYRRLVTIAFIGVLWSASTRADAEDRSIPLLGAGVGVSVGNTFSGGPTTSSPVSVYVPINLAEHFRLEPSFGFWYVGKGLSTTVVEGSTSNGGYAVDVGLGAFYVFRPVPPFSVYLGGRVGANFSGSSEESQVGVTTSLSEADLYANPTMGLEWAVARSFSVGGEAQLGLRWYLDPTVTVGGVSETVSRSKFGTGLEAVVFMRFYL
jgi:hypothetical protein